MWATSEGRAELPSLPDQVDQRLLSVEAQHLLMGRAVLDIIWKLRRVLSGLEDQQALETLLARMRKTGSNGEFLVVISKTTPSSD